MKKIIYSILFNFQSWGAETSHEPIYVWVNETYLISSINVYEFAPINQKTALYIFLEFFIRSMIFYSHLVLELEAQKCW